MAKKDDDIVEEFEDIIEDQGQKLNIPKELPVLMLRDIVVFPYMVVPLFVGREKSKNAIDHALSTHRMILLLTQKNMEIEEPKSEDIYQFGTVALVMRMLKLPDGRVRILAQGLVRAEVRELYEDKPHYSAKIKVIREAEVEKEPIEVEAMIRNVRDGLDEASTLGKNIPPEIMIIAANVDEPGILADLTAATLDLKIEEAQELVEIIEPFHRLKKVYEKLIKELQLLDVQSKISTEAKGEMDKLQKQYFLRQQLKAIQKELGEGSEIQEELKNYQGELKKLKVAKEVREEIEKQINRLGQMHPESAETATAYGP